MKNFLGALPKARRDRPSCLAVRMTKRGAQRVQIPPPCKCRHAKGFPAKTDTFIQHRLIRTQQLHIGGIRIPAWPFACAYQTIPRCLYRHVHLERIDNMDGRVIRTVLRRPFNFGGYRLQNTRPHKIRLATQGDVKAIHDLTHLAYSKWAAHWAQSFADEC